MIARLIAKARASPGLFLGLGCFALGLVVALLLAAHIILLAVHIAQHRELETTVIDNLRSAK